MIQRVFNYSSKCLNFELQNTKNQVETCSSQGDNKKTWYDWKETLLTFIQDDIVDNIDNTNIGNIWLFRTLFEEGRKYKH